MPSLPEPLGELDSLGNDIRSIKRAHSKAGREWPTPEVMAWILNADEGRIALYYRTGKDPHFELNQKVRRKKRDSFAAMRESFQ